VTTESEKRPKITLDLKFIKEFMERRGPTVGPGCCELYSSVSGCYINVTECPDLATCNFWAAYYSAVVIKYVPDVNCPL
jgi:hypothetical protein